MNCKVSPEQLKSEDGSLYHVVSCDACQCQVGILDDEQVYHFFHVIAE